VGAVTRSIRYLALALAMFLPAAAHAADWKAYDTTHFVIYSKSGDKEVERLASRLETIDGLMRMATAISDKIAPIKVRIYEVDNDGDVEAALGLSDSGVAGFYTSNIIGPFAVTPHSTTFHSGDFTPELVLHHEYAHHFMLQYFPAVYPNWYVEGFAELIGSSTIQPDGKVAYGMTAKHRGDRIAVDWVPVQDIFLKPPEKIHDFDLYGQGWAMTHFFTFSKDRAAQLRAYLNALNAGKSPAEAAKVFGNLTTLDREARNYVMGGSFVYKLVSVPIAKPVIQSVHPVSAGEAALIPETIAFSDDDLTAYRKAGARDHEQHRRDEILERIREKVRYYSTDPFALYLLAQAEYSSGHYAESERAADRLLATDPNHVRGLVIRSLDVARSAGGLSGPGRLARAEEARALALKANRGDPNDPLPLLAFYQSYHLAGLKPIPAAVENLLDVSLTLPDNTRVRQLLVDEYSSERKWALAIAALAPMANDPHDSPLRTAAREKMAQLVAAQAKEQGRTAGTRPAAASVTAAKP
jgi:tetratricopeptide (TPR) repeat protein